MPLSTRTAISQVDHIETMFAIRTDLLRKDVDTLTPKVDAMHNNMFGEHERSYATFDDDVLHFRTTSEDAGYDMYAIEDKWLWPLIPRRIKLNMAVELQSRELGLVTSRSGQSLLGNFAIPGVIDTGFRGQISATMVRLHIFPKKIRKGERVAQLVILDYKKPVWKHTEELSKDTQRGEKGFGSSGVM